MTDTTEQEALAQAVAAAGRRMQDYNIMAEENVLRQSIDAHARAIEQHEAFRQEVSDAAVEYNEHGAQSGWLGFDHFIIAKPDPLAQAWLEAWPGTPEENAIAEANVLLAAVEKRGGKIVWGEGKPYEPFWDNPDGPGAA